MPDDIMDEDSPRGVTSSYIDVLASTSESDLRELAKDLVDKLSEMYVGGEDMCGVLSAWGTGEDGNSKNLVGKLDAVVLDGTSAPHWKAYSEILVEAGVATADEAWGMRTDAGAGRVAPHSQQLPFTTIRDVMIALSLHLSVRGGLIAPPPKQHAHTPFAAPQQPAPQPLPAAVEAWARGKSLPALHVRALEAPAATLGAAGVAGVALSPDVDFGIRHADAAAGQVNEGGGFMRSLRVTNNGKQPALLVDVVAVHEGGVFNLADDFGISRSSGRPRAAYGVLLRPGEEFHVSIRLNFGEGDIGIHQAILLATFISHRTAPPPALRPSQAAGRIAKAYGEAFPALAGGARFR
mmetsp:Transcript_24763/g.78277  ORF Transcript_24763/g.78277 Transcript_24763/m.78277 type:complete len:351 (+) Transcript_24763:260-1312(+)